MQGGAGLIDKHPSYIEEKQELMDKGVDAFAALDIHNMRSVVAWCKQWGVELPDEVAEYYAQTEEAVTELKARGMEM